MSSALHPAVVAVTERIVRRSQPERQAYLRTVHEQVSRTPALERLSCANVAHAFAALPDAAKRAAVQRRRPRLGIVTAYNDMLSAHRPYESYPELIRDEAARAGAVAQVAGATPAMCDGVTQGNPGMELSLFSRDVIAMSTAVALSHDVYDAALLLGICDKIVPGLLIGALSAGHLPCVFVPAGPMPSGLGNAEKARVREMYVKGEATRQELLDVEQQAYHAPGTCTFYGTANSNQVLLEAMGLQLSGSSFVAPYDERREPLTRAAVRAAVHSRGGQHFDPIGVHVDERAIVNAMVALMATGGSTNHLIHWIAVAKAAGIVIDWSDFEALSKVVPLLARVYPNGSADVNAFEQAGGVGFVIRELIEVGLMHPDIPTVSGQPLRAALGRPVLRKGQLAFDEVPAASADPSVLRGVADPFDSTGGLALLTGNLGRSVIKVSAVAPEHRLVRAPAYLAEDQEQVVAAFEAGELDRDVIVVLRGQGPRANGMPELHRLTPVLGALQRQGRHVALVTDGRMSGASGRVPAAIHVTPEAVAGGRIGLLRTGDLLTLDAEAGTLEAAVSESEWRTRQEQGYRRPAHQGPLGLGRDLFAGMRATVSGAEDGAITWRAPSLPAESDTDAGAEPMGAIR